MKIRGVLSYFAILATVAVAQPTPVNVLVDFQAALSPEREAGVLATKARDVALSIHLRYMDGLLEGRDDKDVAHVWCLESWSEKGALVSRISLDEMKRDALFLHGKDGLKKISSEEMVAMGFPPLKDEVTEAVWNLVNTLISRRSNVSAARDPPISPVYTYGKVRLAKKVMDDELQRLHEKTEALPSYFFYYPKRFSKQSIGSMLLVRNARVPSERNTITVGEPLAKNEFGRSGEVLHELFQADEKSYMDMLAKEQVAFFEEMQNRRKIPLDPAALPPGFLPPQGKPRFFEIRKRIQSYRILANTQHEIGGTNISCFVVLQHHRAGENAADKEQYRVGTYVLESERGGPWNVRMWGAQTPFHVGLLPFIGQPLNAYVDEAKTISHPIHENLKSFAAIASKQLLDKRILDRWVAKEER